MCCLVRVTAMGTLEFCLGACWVVSVVNFAGVGW